MDERPTTEILSAEPQGQRLCRTFCRGQAGLQGPEGRTGSHKVCSEPGGFPESRGRPDEGDLSSLTVRPRRTTRPSSRKALMFRVMNLLTIASLLLALGAVVAWVRSYLVMDSIVVSLVYGDSVWRLDSVRG